jgi:hypothetical protein
MRDRPALKSRLEKKKTGKRDMPLLKYLRNEYIWKPWSAATDEA